ncbi:MAG: twin-arginine translocase TatA/TatE family subunit [bacterium]
MFGLGTPELLIILVVIIMFFGVGKLPDVAKQLGGGVRSFQKSLRGEDEDEDEKDAKSDDEKKLKED